MTAEARRVISPVINAVNGCRAINNARLIRVNNSWSGARALSAESCRRVCRRSVKQLTGTRMMHDSEQPVLSENSLTTQTNTAANQSSNIIYWYMQRRELWAVRTGEMEQNCLNLQILKWWMNVVTGRVRVWDNNKAQRLGLGKKANMNQPKASNQPTANVDKNGNS